MKCKFCNSNTRNHGLIKQPKIIKNVKYIFVYQRVECKDCCKNFKGELLRKEILQESKV
jgi:hypothetical protein